MNQTETIYIFPKLILTSLITEETVTIHILNLQIWQNIIISLWYMLVRSASSYLICSPTTTADADTENSETNLRSCRTSWTFLLRVYVHGYTLMNIYMDICVWEIHKEHDRMWREWMTLRWKHMDSNLVATILFVHEASVCTRMNWVATITFHVWNEVIHLQKTVVHVMFIVRTLTSSLAVNFTESSVLNWNAFGSPCLSIPK